MSVKSLQVGIFVLFLVLVVELYHVQMQIDLRESTSHFCYNPNRMGKHKRTDNRLFE